MSQEISYWLQISSGKGPSECAYFVGKLAAIILKEANQAKLNGRVIKSILGEQPDTFLSILISLQVKDNNCGRGEMIEFIHSWQGTIKWICQSPFRPHHKRKNWLVGVTALNSVTNNNHFSSNEVRFSTMRSSGAGGQNVNKLETAVRATHLPTGISVTASEERSQYLNKKLALAKLAIRLESKQEQQKKELEKECWQIHLFLERGNPIRIYRGPKFELLA
ncbi:MAG: peptide chain release factor H [Crocosphaera sp.]